MNTSIPKSVLVVEDDFASRQYLQLLLKKLDYTFFVAETGEQAKELMSDKSVDIMLLDIALGPGISGLELGVAFKEENRFMDTPIVAVTAFSQDKLQTLEKAGFSDYMAKPYTIVQLKDMLDKHLS